MLFLLKKYSTHTHQINCRVKGTSARNGLTFTKDVRSSGSKIYFDKFYLYLKCEDFFLVFGLAICCIYPFKYSITRTQFHLSFKVIYRNKTYHIFQVEPNNTHVWANSTTGSLIANYEDKRFHYLYLILNDNLAQYSKKLSLVEKIACKYSCRNILIGA